MVRIYTSLIAAVLVGVMATESTAVTKRHLLTESDPSVAPVLDNAFLREFADLSALISLTPGPVRNVAGNRTVSQTINGLTWAEDRFLMIVEADPGGVGVSLLEFWTLADMTAANPFQTTYLGDDIGGSGVSVGGLTYSNGTYYVVTEPDPSPFDDNVFLREFTSLSNLRSLTQGAVSLLGTEIGGTGVSVTGLDTDGDDWFLVTEPDPGPFDDDVFLRTFDTLADLKSLTQKSVPLIGTDIGGTAVSTRALMSVPDLSVIPLPASLFSLLGAFATLGLLRRRRSSVA